MKEYPDSCVYWIHLPEHTDITKEGYVGVSVHGADARFKSHLSEANSGSKLIVHNAIRKYGNEIVLTTLVKGPPEYCLEVEFKLRPFQKIGWNIACGGTKSQLGMKHSEDTRAIISERGFGRKHKEESKAKMSKSRLGKPLSASHAESVRLAAKGRIISDKARSAASIANSKRMNGCTWDNSASVAKIKSLDIWNKPNSNTNNWLLAGEIYKYIIANPNHGDSKISSFIGIDRTQIRTMMKKIKQGWNPFEDESWLIFSSKSLTPETLEIS